MTLSLWTRLAISLCVMMCCNACTDDSSPPTSTRPFDMDISGEDASRDMSLDASSPDMSTVSDMFVDMSTDMSGSRYPLRRELDEVPEVPELFTSFNGTRQVEGVMDWMQWRRAELLDLFAFYIYGYVPARVAVTSEVTRDEPDFTPGLIRYQEVSLKLAGVPDPLHLSVFMPAASTSPPGVFIALTKCGNQEVLTDARIRLTESWHDSSGCGSAEVELTRGIRATNWPVERIIRAGYAFIAIHESDIDPDTLKDKTFEDGIHPYFALDAYAPDERWGRLSAWAWGLSRVVDWVESSERFDVDKIAVVGHSRRGKTALLAGARDERIDLIIAHQSGRGGSAMGRGAQGEPAWILNPAFPSWFNDIYPTFDRHPERLPIDQHMLVALSAPRLVLLTDGEADLWADPEGSLRAAQLASPAWALHGVQGLVGEESAPGLEGRLSWQIREGDHALEWRDWDVFLAFAAEHWE